MLEKQKVFGSWFKKLFPWGFFPKNICLQVFKQLHVKKRMKAEQRVTEMNK